jgi:3-isopropylmalate/(R)-2-methylmalate dehydratase small subunit
METTLQGKVYKFGDNINSDIIIAGRYLIYIEPDKLAEHAFEVLGEGFPARLRNFEILAAGRNFGCGSAREQAVTAIQGLGIKAVVAVSFARTFYRNAINSGLTIIECPDLYSAVKESDEIQIDIAEGKIQHQAKVYAFPKFPNSMRQLLECGGLANYLRALIQDGGKTQDAEPARH